ncbi:MAG: response regulator, partial [Opitutaceae bacterium]
AKFMAIFVQNILLAEDTPDDAFLMRLALQWAGIASALTEVGDGREALAYLSGKGAFGDRSRYPLPDVLFLDVKMPWMSGFDVLSRMASEAHGPLPPAVILSSTGEQKDRELARSLGAAFYAVKPPTPELFATLAAQLGLEWARDGFPQPSQAPNGHTRLVQPR